jgi:signal transduction histidine kinase
MPIIRNKNSRENLKLVKEYDSNIPTVLVGDPIRLHQIILNLVSNVKFTSEGKITVSVRLIDEDSENVTIEFLSRYRNWDSREKIRFHI